MRGERRQARAARLVGTQPRGRP